MIDVISNANALRELNAAQNRAQAMPSQPGASPPNTNLAPDQRIEGLQAAVEKLIKKSLPSNSKLQIEQDKSTGEFIYRSIDPNTGEVVRQWPPESLLQLREDLKTMSGMLLDTEA